MHEITYVNPGDKLWYVIKGRGYNYKSYRGDIIVPVTVEEVTDIYAHPDPAISDASCWSHRFIDSSKDYVSVPTAEHDENGWNVWEHKPLSWLGDMKPVNQMVWIDEPVGHAITVGDAYDGLFLTLEEAHRYAIPSKKKHLLRRLHQYRNNVCGFIASSWKSHGKTHPGFKRWPDKQVYVRTKGKPVAQGERKYRKGY